LPLPVGDDVDRLAAALTGLEAGAVPDDAGATKLLEPTGGMLLLSALILAVFTAVTQFVAARSD
jgi:hypothetical protein